MRYQRTDDARDEGFTLIELLVVIIIIGILAAIAIPIFLNQRTKAYDSAAKSDLKSLADHEELYLTGNEIYGTMAELVADGVDVRASNGVTVAVVRFDAANGYCLSASHAASSLTFYWDSGAGGLQPAGSAGCPVTTTGTAGGPPLVG